MSRDRTRLSILLLLGVLSSSLPAGEQPVAEELIFNEAVFLERAGDAVWVRKPLVSLGMIGVMAFAPVYRLSPDLEKRLEPLVTRTRGTEVRETPEIPGVFHFGLPEAEGPITLVRLKTRAILRSPREARRAPVHEIIEARVITVEQLTESWQRHREELDSTLRELFPTSLQEGEHAERLKRMQPLLEKAASALRRLEEAVPSSDLSLVTHGIDPRIRISRQVSNEIIEEWGGVLRRVIETLGVAPPESLPPRREPVDALKALLEAANLESFVKHLRECPGGAALDQHLFWSSEKKRTIHAWEIAEAGSGAYAKFREEARVAQEERLKYLQEREKRPEPPPTWEVERWKVELREAGPELLERHRIFRGSLVVRADEGSPFREGDVILDYSRLYDLVMGSTRFGASRAVTLRLAEMGQPVPVARGGRIVRVSPGGEGS